MASAPSPIQVGGLVPNVWFDLFGRIIPAAYLLLGVVGVKWGSAPAVSLREYLEKYPVTGLPIAFLLFVGATYMVGWLLGTVSYWFIEFPCTFLRNLLARGKPVIPRRIEAIITKHCGDDWSDGLNKEAKKRKARDHCTYLIWHSDPALAIIVGRWDAESLGARSTVISGFPLLYLYATQSHEIEWILWVITLVSFVAYLYHSNRAMNARFDMVLALLGSRRESSTSPSR